jgi:hypothetical protein
MKNTRLPYRHGDCELYPVESIPESAKKVSSKTLMRGSGNHPHSFDKGTLYEFDGDDFIIGYLDAKDTTLYHIEHGENDGKSPKEAKINDGIYEIRRQVADTNEGMKPVQD